MRNASTQFYDGPHGQRTRVIDMRQSRGPARRFNPVNIPGWTIAQGDSVFISATSILVDGVGWSAIAKQEVEITTSGYVIARAARGTIDVNYLNQASAPTATDVSYHEWAMCAVTLTGSIAQITARYHIGPFYIASVFAP